MDPLTRSLMMGAGSAAAIEFVAAAATGTAAKVSTLVVNKPTGTQEGDLMVALMLAINSNITWTGDTGWTEVIDQGSLPNIRVAYKIAGASEGSSFTFTLSASEKSAGTILTFRNAAYDVVGTISATHSSDVQTAPAITLSSAGSGLVALFGTTSALRTYSNPTSGLIAASSFSADGPSFQSYYELDLSSGSTGTRSATASTGPTNPGCILVGIKPA